MCMHAMKVYWVVEVMLTSFVTLVRDAGDRCFTPWLLYPGVNRPWDPLSRILGGPQTWTGCFGKIENLGIGKFHYHKGVWRMLTISVLTDFYFSCVCSVYKVMFRSFIYSIVCLQYFQVNIVCTCCGIE